MKNIGLLENFEIGKIAENGENEKQGSKFGIALKTVLKIKRPKPFGF